MRVRHSFKGSFQDFYIIPCEVNIFLKSAGQNQDEQLFFHVLVPIDLLHFPLLTRVTLSSFGVITLLLILYQFSAASASPFVVALVAAF